MSRNNNVQLISQIKEHGSPEERAAKSPTPKLKEENFLKNYEFSEYQREKNRPKGLKIGMQPGFLAAHSYTGGQGSHPLVSKNSGMT